MTMVFLIFGVMILTGFGKAVRDTIAHHFNSSVFAEIENKKLYKFFKSDFSNTKLWNNLVRFDAWHIADFLMYVGVMGAIVLSAIIQDWWLAIIYYGGSMLFFQIFYKITLLKKN